MSICEQRWGQKDAFLQRSLIDNCLKTNNTYTMPTKITILIGALLLALNLSAAVERHALVIGNANYQSSPLRNPLNDARDMAAALKGLGFQVQSLLDADAGQMEQAILDFGDRLRTGGVGLFYYAGHGVQAQGSNYLIPLQANISREIQLKRKAIDAGLVLDAMGAANNGLNIVILDACRDNPYENSFRNTTRGLARMDSPTGSLIAYATAPGDVAADGDGRNGVFTKHLLEQMQKPGVQVEQVFKQVTQAVHAETRQRQTPFTTSSLLGEFYFKPAASPVIEAEQLITLTLRSNVYDDQVYINGAYVGQTKLVTQLAAGWHDIEVRKSGYRTYSARLLLDKDQTIRARLQRGTDPTPQPATIQAAISAPQPAPLAQTTPSTIDGLSLDDWLLVYGSNPITIASLNKVVAYERQHGGNAASRSYINKGLKVALANVNSADDLLEYQRKFGYLPGAPAQIEARLAELLAAGASRADLIRLRSQFPASATLRLQLAGAYHQAKLFDAAAGEYQSWLGLTDSSHPERKSVLEALVAAREGRLLYKAGDIIQDCPECPQMVYIPAGSFRMGDIQGGGDSDEKSVHRVSVKAFLMSATEVTFDQWDACVAAGGCSHKPSDESWGRGSRPVINVSWKYITDQYIPWLNKKTGEQYRLPTEAEWEYAARAGSETRYFFGNNSDDMCKYGNGADLEAKKQNSDWTVVNCNDGYYRTAPVASFAANAFGLYDMHGNVWEWTQDCWNGSYKGAPSDGTAWLSGNCSRRVLRGGSWYGNPIVLRSANRLRYTTDYRNYNNGFRLARTLD